MARFFLQPGFRFYPTDIELVKYYLKRKVMRKPFRIDAISEIDIYKFAPWDLPGKSCLQNGDREWYFFCSRDRKYANGRRINRATDIGYWKTTGNDRHICHNSQTVGIKKTLIFYVGRAPRGDRTDWVMHEYRLEDKKLDEMGVMQDAFVLCKIFEKSGLGPKNGEQHGALFEEEDWDDEMLKNPEDPIPNSDFGSPFLVPANEQNISPLVPANEQNIPPIMGTAIPGTVPVSSSEPISCQITSSHASGGLPSLPEDDDIASLLAIFDNNVNSSCYNENSGPIGINRSAIEAPPLVDGNDIYNGLEDLSAQSDLTTIDGIRLPTILEVEYPLDQTLLGADSYFMELDDLNRPLQHPVELKGYDCISFGSQCSGYTSYDNFGGTGKSVIPLGGPGDSMSRSMLSDGSDIFQNQFSVPPHDTNCGHETVELTVHNPVVEEIEEREGSIYDSQTLTRRGSFHHHW